MADSGRLPKPENILLADKVKTIFDVLCHGDKKELLELFTDRSARAKDPDYDTKRLKYLERIMRNRTARVSHLKNAYGRLPLSKLRMGKEPLFTEKSFFESTLERFRARVKAYVRYREVQSMGVDAGYGHLYVFDQGSEKLLHYGVAYFPLKSVVCADGVEIRLESESGVEYSGCVFREEDRLVYFARHARDHMTLLFNASFATPSEEVCFDRALFGVGIGIDDRYQKIPIAKKVALLPHKLAPADLRRLYLLLNETQLLEARENLLALEPGVTLDGTFVRRYSASIAGLHRFFSHVKYSETIVSTIREHMLFTELHAFAMLFEKYAHNQNFFLNDRKRIVLELLRYVRKYGYTKVVMALPLHDERENIFLYEAVGKESIREMVLQLAGEGVVFEIVFVVRRPQDYRAERMEGVFAQLAEVGVRFGFVDEADVKEQVLHMDFIYTSGEAFAILQDHPEQKSVFTVTTSAEFVRGCVSDFRKLWNASYSYAEVLDEAYTLGVHDEVLMQLMGKWYGYFFGSLQNAQNEHIVWERTFEIMSDYSAIARDIGTAVQKRHRAFGTLSVAPKQSLLNFISETTQGSYYVMIENTRIAEIFSAALFSTQYRSEREMMTIGLFSRKRIGVDVAKTLLGTSQEALFLAENRIQSRIRAYLNALEVSDLTQSR